MTISARIVVVGGGFAGLESAFLLRAKLGARAQITLVSDRDQFLFKPNTIYIPFGASEESLLIPLEKRNRQARHPFRPRRFSSRLDKEARVVRAGGDELPYDYLVLATGAGMRPEEVPGLAEHAETIWTADEMSVLGARLRALVEGDDDGGKRTILFLVPPNNKCAGPLYEIVFMVETWLRRQKTRERFDLVWTTYEPSYIQAFGPKPARRRRRRVRYARHRGAHRRGGHGGDADSVHYENGRAPRLRPARRLSALHRGRRLRPLWAARRRAGFVACDAGSRQRDRRTSGSMPLATRATFRSSRRSWPSCRPTPSPRTSPPASRDESSTFAFDPVRCA